MWPFSKRDDKNTRILRDRNSRIEIVAHKRATKRQIEEVRRANESLSGVLERNGFTLKIFLAAGGKHTNLKER